MIFLMKTVDASLRKEIFIASVVPVIYGRDIRHEILQHLQTAIHKFHPCILYIVDDKNPSQFIQKGGRNEQ